jgi:hypothetical protein
VPAVESKLPLKAIDAPACPRLRPTMRNLTRRDRAIWTTNRQKPEQHQDDPWELRGYGGSKSRGLYCRGLAKGHFE